MSVWRSGTFWTAVASVAGLLTLGWLVYTHFNPREVFSASVSVVDVQRAKDKDGDGYIAFAVDCALTNTGTVAFSVFRAQPYTFGPGVLPDWQLSRAGVNPLSKSVVQAEAGKIEPFQVFVYFHKSFIEKAGMPKQSLETGGLKLGGTILVKIKFEARAADTSWDAAVAPQPFAFISDELKSVDPLDTTPAKFTQLTSAPSRTHVVR